MYKDYDDYEEEEYVSPPPPVTPIIRKIFPDTVLISVSTHGSIETSRSSFSFEEAIPDTKIVIANATAPGVCNFSNADHTDALNEILMEEFESFDKTKSIEKFAPIALKSIKLYDYFNILRVKKNEKDHSPRTKNYINLFNRGYNYQVRRNKDHIIDKTYEITPEENKERLDLKEMNRTNNSFKVLNMKDIYGKQGVDLLDIVPPTISVYDRRILTLRKAIEYLNKYGAKNIIIFDFSCNAYSSTEVITPRAERRLRRSDIKESGITYTIGKRQRSSSSKSSKNKKSASSSKKSKKYKTRNDNSELFEKIDKMPRIFRKTRQTKSLKTPHTNKGSRSRKANSI